MMYSHFDLLVNFLLFLFFINLHYFYLIDLINFKKELSFFINFQVMFECKIMDQKTRVGGVNAAQTNNQLVRKQIRVLEGRLDKSLLKFNE